MALLLETTDHESFVDHCKLTTNIFTVLNDQNLFHSAIDKPPGVSGGSKIQEDSLDMNLIV